MKTFLILSISTMVISSVISQSTLDNSLLDVSTDMANKLSQKNMKKIVVLYVTDISKSQTVAGTYIANAISVHIVNDPGSFYVFDRDNLSMIAEANKLIAEGYVDAEKAKEIGQMLSVEAIIIGNYTVLSKTLKLTLKALDVNNGFVIAASMKDLPLDKDAGTLLGISGNNSNNINRGFNNHPISSNESFNNPETVDKDCEIQNVGDYCFTNNLSIQVEVKLWHFKKSPSLFSNPRMTLMPGQTQCQYKLLSDPWNYIIYESEQKRDRYYRNGQVLIEKCKSKTFVVK